MTLIHAFPDDAAHVARRLSEAIGGAVALIEVHHFPDGESLPRVQPTETKAIVYRSLNTPNEKLIEVLLVADGLRRAGAGHICLVAPYLPYLRQDLVFKTGEPLSRNVILPLLANAFDAVVTVDPHLHRTKRLCDVAPQTRWIALSGATAIADALSASEIGSFDVVVGPDAESAQWVKIVAHALNLSWWTFDKTRDADRDVHLTPPQRQTLAKARVLIVDDICASGGTLAQATRLCLSLGASQVEATVTHALYGQEDAEKLAAAGLARLRSADGCIHPTNAFSLAPLIATALRKEHIT